MGLPELLTERLLLRAFTLADVPAVAGYCGEWDVARMTANIPHPYDESMAEAWISNHARAFEQGSSATFAITKRSSGSLLGAIAVNIDPANHAAELGYWIGKPHWDQGYATEAARRVLQFGFEELDLNRIHARHMAHNPASGRVMQKAGMKPEGVLRQSIYRWDRYQDAVLYSILRAEFEVRKT